MPFSVVESIDCPCLFRTIIDALRNLFCRRIDLKGEVCLVKIYETTMNWIPLSGGNGCAVCAVSFLLIFAPGFFFVF